MSNCIWPYKCCDTPCLLGSKCVCEGIGHDINPTCSNGQNGAACCNFEDDCAQSAMTTGYCGDNKCIIKWDNGHACENPIDCMSGACTKKICTE